MAGFATKKRQMGFIHPELAGACMPRATLGDPRTMFPNFHLVKAPGKKHISSSDEFLLRPTRENMKHVLKQMEAHQKAHQSNTTMGENNKLLFYLQPPNLKRTQTNQTKQTT